MRVFFSLLFSVCLAVRAAEDPMDALVGVLKETADAQLQKDILSGMSNALRGKRTAPMPAGWAEIEDKLTGNADAQISALAQGLGLTFGSQKALSSLRQTALNPSAAIDARRAAVQSLLSIRDSALPQILLRFLGTPELRPESLRGLAAYEDASSAPAILVVYPRLSNAEKKDALNTLASRATFAKPLLAAVETGIVPAKDLTAEIVRQLRNLKNEDIDKQVQKVWGAFRETSADKQKEIERYTRIFRAGGSTPGDASRGRVVFSKICQQCHTLFDAGGTVGPDLTGSNRGDLGYILQNMVDPNAVIPNDYRTSTIELTDERVITGIIKQQNDKALTVATANEQLTIPRSEVKSAHTSEISMMPEGLLTPLADQEVRDLIYYLSRPGQVPMSAAAQ